jgi:nitrite reductase/ring-hydroxylating ferredoxin subunit
MTQQVLPEVSSIKAGAMGSFDVGGRRVAVANVSGTLFAFDDTCTHRGCSLATGRLSGTTVTCRCHGSEFDVRTGAVLKGPAQQPVRSYRIDAETGTVHVDA